LKQEVKFLILASSRNNCNRQRKSTVQVSEKQVDSWICPCISQRLYTWQAVHTQT